MTGTDVDVNNPANQFHVFLGDATNGLVPITHEYLCGTTVIGYQVITVGYGGIRLDLMRMITNWRLCETILPSGLTYARSWCYKGLRPTTFLLALGAALEWAPRWAPDTEPLYFTKANR